MTIDQRVKVRLRELKKWWLLVKGDFAVVVSYDYHSVSANIYSQWILICTEHLGGIRCLH